MKRVAGGALGILLVGGLTFYGLATNLQPTARTSWSPAICDINISAPARDRLNKSYIRNTDSLTVTVSGTATRCPSATVTVTKSENGAAETAVGTPSTNGVGVWTQGLTVTNAVNTKVFARMTTGGHVTEASIIFDASTAKPKLAIAAPVATGNGGVINLVAAHHTLGCTNGGGNEHAYQLEPGWIMDADCAANGQIVTSFTVTGANGGTVDVSYLGSSVYSSAVTSTPQTFAPTLTLTDITRGDLVFSATNGSGTTSTTFLTRVMTLTPAPVVGPDGGTPRMTLIDDREASVDVSYVLPAVPSTISTASIELQWTTGLMTALTDQDCLRSYAYASAAVLCTNVGNTYTKQVGACTTASSGGPTGTGTSIADGTCLWDYVAPSKTNNRRADGGNFSIDGGPMDIGIFAIGSNLGCLRAGNPNNVTGANNELKFCPHDTANGGFTRGLVMQIPDDCVLYDPSLNPQVWVCADGSELAAGATRTRRLHGLPPNNSYYIFVVPKY